MNRVRRELALWTNAELARRFGTVFYPVPDIARFLYELRRAVTELQPMVPEQVAGIVARSALA